MNHGGGVAERMAPLAKVYQIDHMGVGVAGCALCRTVYTLYVGVFYFGHTMRFFCSNLLILSIQLPIVQYFRISVT